MSDSAPQPSQSASSRKKVIVRQPSTKKRPDRAAPAATADGSRPTRKPEQPKSDPPAHLKASMKSEAAKAEATSRPPQPTNAAEATQSKASAPREWTKLDKPSAEDIPLVQVSIIILPLITLVLALRVDRHILQLVGYTHNHCHFSQILTGNITRTQPSA